MLKKTKKNRKEIAKMIQCGEYYFPSLKDAQDFLIRKIQSNPVMREIYGRKEWK